MHPLQASPAAPEGPNAIIARNNRWPAAALIHIWCPTRQRQSSYAPSDLLLRMPSFLGQWPWGHGAGLVQRITVARAHRFLSEQPMAYCTHLPLSHNEASICCQKRTIHACISKMDGTWMKTHTLRSTRVVFGDVHRPESSSTQFTEITPSPWWLQRVAPPSPSARASSSRSLLSSTPPLVTRPRQVSP